MWVGKDVLNQKRWTREDALSNYYKNLSLSENFSEEQGKALSDTLPAEQVQSVNHFVQTSISAFSILDIINHLPDFLESSHKLIHAVLGKLMAEGKLTLLLRQSEDKNNILWIRTAVLEAEGLTREQVFDRYYGPKLEQIRLFVQSLESVFTFSTITDRFPDSNGYEYEIIQRVLNSLISSGELTAIGERGLAWIKSAVLHEKGWTPEQALALYNNRDSQ